MPVYLRAGALGSQECAGFSEAGITTGYELPDTRAGISIWIVQKSSECS